MVIGIIAILAAVVLIAIHPARQFAQARDSQRSANVNAILNAIGQRIADNKGIFEGDYTIAGDPTTFVCKKLPTTVKDSQVTDHGTGAVDEDGNLGCLIPTYLNEMPSDPKAGAKYQVVASSTAGRIVVSAPAAEITIPISVTR